MTQFLLGVLWWRGDLTARYSGVRWTLKGRHPFSRHPCLSVVAWQVTTIAEEAFAVDGRLEGARRRAWSPRGYQASGWRRLRSGSSRRYNYPSPRDLQSRARPRPKPRRVGVVGGTAAVMQRGAGRSEGTLHQRPHPVLALRFRPAVDLAPSSVSWWRPL